MKTISIVISLVVLTVSITTIPALGRAASIADNVGGNSNSNSNNNTSSSDNGNKLPSSGSTEQPVTAQKSGGRESLVLTAAPDKPEIAAGAAQTIHVKAAMDNGTGISDVTIQALVQDYVTGKQKVLLGGQTDDKGILDLTATIGPHAKTGQFLIVVNASKDNLQKQTVASGFVVNEKSSGGGSSSSSGGGSSSGSGGSKSKCSGSSCK